MNIFSQFAPQANDPAFRVPTSMQPFMAVTDSPTRTNPSGMTKDARRELTGFTRTQLVRKSRWLYNNMGLLKRMIKGVARYSIGSGITPIPDTGNDVFDAQLTTYFGNWADNSANCDVRNKLSFWRMQKAVLRGMFRDGDAWALKVIGQDQSGTGLAVQPSQLRVQWLESHRIGNLMDSSYGYDDKGYKDGVKTDLPGAATNYRILIDKNPKAMDLTGELLVDYSQMIRVYDPERAEHDRGVPWIHHGQNSCLDIMDLVALEKHAVKLHSALAAAIKKKTADASKTGFTGDLVKEKQPNRPGQAAPQRLIAFENFMSGAGILQLGQDEEFDLFNSTRPSITFAGFIDFLVRDIAWGFGVSPEFIWSVAGLGGTNSRVILEDAKWFFEEIQDLMVHLFCQPIYMTVIAIGIERGELVVPAGIEDPYSCNWQGPAKVTVDQGKEGQLELERLASGCGTWEEFWAARGKSGRVQVKKRIDEIAEAMDYAKTKKVPFDYIVALNNGGDGTPTAKNAADTGKLGSGSDPLDND